MTIPSLTAAFVAFKASSILNFFSFNSLSVVAPTFIKATPFDSLAKRLAICSYSFLDVVSFNCASSLSICSCKRFLSPLPPIIVVESFVTIIFLLVPRLMRIYLQMVI